MAAKNKFLNAMKMPSIDDMFSSEADRQRESGDLVTEVPLSELHPFVGHPFEVRDDEDIQAFYAFLFVQVPYQHNGAIIGSRPHSKVLHQPPCFSSNLQIGVTGEVCLNWVNHNKPRSKRNDCIPNAFIIECQPTVDFFIDKCHFAAVCALFFQTGFYRIRNPVF